MQQPLTNCDGKKIDLDALLPALRIVDLRGEYPINLVEDGAGKMQVAGVSMDDLVATEFSSKIQIFFPNTDYCFRGKITSGAPTRLLRLKRIDQGIYTARAFKSNWVIRAEIAIYLRGGKDPCCLVFFSAIDRLNS